MDTFIPMMDSTDAQREILDAVRRHAGQMTPGLKPDAPDISSLRASVQEAHHTYQQVGTIPPVPPTVRGRLGSWLVRLIRRALFWYTAQIVEFHRSITGAVEHQMAVLERLIHQVAGEGARTAQLPDLIDEIREELLRETADRKRHRTWVNSELQWLRKSADQHRTALDQLRHGFLADLRQQFDTELRATREDSHRNEEALHDLRRQFDTELRAAREDSHRNEEALHDLRQQFDTELRAAREDSHRNEETLQSLGRRLTTDSDRLGAEVLSLSGLVAANGSQIRSLREQVGQLAAAREALRQELEQLPAMQQAHTRAFREEVASLSKAQRSEILALRQEVEQLPAVQNNCLQVLRQQLTDVSARGEQQQAATGAALNAAATRLGSLEARLVEAQQKIASLHSGMLAQDMRISVLIEQARKRLDQMTAAQLAAIAGEREHAMDALYLTFEDQFRGTREDIKERFRVYLPFLRAHGAGAPDRPVLDVGCGRGEWIELLRDESLAASGVDSNRAMLAQCSSRNLKAVEGDAVEYLRALDTDSLGALTAFHVIEHLPFATLFEFLAEAARVLKPGGVAIFETPNPANILVSTERFYFDPTHRSPLPAPLMRFLAEERGLCHVEVLELHPWPEAFKVSEDGSPMAQRFNQYFYGPQDYAIIGRKA